MAPAFASVSAIERFKTCERCKKEYRGEEGGNQRDVERGEMGGGEDTTKEVNSRDRCRRAERADVRSKSGQ